MKKKRSASNLLYDLPVYGYCLDLTATAESVRGGGNGI